MDYAELEKKIHIILDKELLDTRNNKYPSRTYDEREPEVIDLGGRTQCSAYVPPPIFEDTEKYSLSYENLRLMRILYNRLNISDQREFIGICCSCFDPNSKYKKAAHLVFEFLFRNKGVKEAFTQMKIRNFSSESRLIMILEIVSEILRHEHNIFTDSTLDELENEINYLVKEGPLKSIYVVQHRQILDQITLIRIKRLKKELSGYYNPEINEDFNKTINLGRKLGISEQILDRIYKLKDKIYRIPEDDEFEYSKEIAPMREISKSIFDFIADKIYKKTKDPFPKERSTPIGNYRLYIRKHLKFRKEAEDSILDGLIETIEYKGSHSLTSEKEYYRLVMNMFAEVFLLLFERLDAFLRK